MLITEEDLYQILVEHNNTFLEHLTDHLQMVFAFLILGFFLTIYTMLRLFETRIRIDYDMPKGKIIMLKHNGKKHFVIKPDGLMNFFDVIFLLLFSKGDPVLLTHERKRIRVISIIIVSLLILSVIWGVLLMLSALERDMNPFNHIRYFIELFRASNYF